MADAFFALGADELPEEAYSLAKPLIIGDFRPGSRINAEIQKAGKPSMMRQIGTACRRPGDSLQ